MSYKFCPELRTGLLKDIRIKDLWLTRAGISQCFIHLISFFRTRLDYLNSGLAMDLVLDLCNLFGVY